MRAGARSAGDRSPGRCQGAGGTRSLTPSRAVRPIEQIHQVDDGDTASGGAEAGLDLHEASRIGGDYHVPPAGPDVADLTLAKRRRENRQGPVVRTSSTPTP